MENPPSLQPPAPDLRRPVGGTEYSWCRAVPGGTGTTVLALLLSSPILVPSPSLPSALRSLQTSHPILRARLLQSPSSPGDPPSFSIPASPPPLLLRSSTLTLTSPHPAGGSPFHSLLELELNHNPWSDPDPADPAPVFFATTYELPEPGRAALVLRFHTAACDRTSAVAVLKELMGLLTGRSDGPDPGEADADPGPYDDVAVRHPIEDLIPKRDAWKPFWARGKDLLGYSINGLRSATLRFDDTGSARSTGFARLVMTRDQTARLLRECKERGVKLCAAIAAAALLAARSSKQLEAGRHETYSVVTLIDCRKYLDPSLHDHNVGFYHSAITNAHSVHGGEGLWELALRCHSSYSNAMSSKKHLTDIGDLNFLMCKAIENPHLTPHSSLRTGLISVFEEPVIYESSELHRSLGVEDYVGCSSVHGVGPSVAVFDTIRDGQLDCAYVYPSPLHSKRQMQDTVEQMKHILVEGSHLKEGGSSDQI